MKRIFLILPLLPILALVNSCDNGNNNNNGEPDFSQKTVEENKQIVEESGISMVRTMEDMKDLQTTDAAVSLGNLLDNSDPFKSETVGTSKVNMLIHAVAGLKQGEGSLHALFNALKSPAELADDPQTIQEVWDDAVGTYEWNAEFEEWDYTEGGDEIVFLFPATENGTENNANLTISGYQGVVISNPLEDEYDGDLPAAVMADLSADGTTIMSYSFAAEYNDQGIPSSVASDLTIESYTWSIDITNTDTEVSAMYRMKHNDETILDIGGTGKGLFTQENIDNNTVTHTDTYTYTDYVWNDETQTYDEVEVTETDTWDELEFEEVIKSAEAHFQLYNIAIRGEVDIKSLVDELRTIYPDDEPDNFDAKQAAEDAAAAANKYASLYALNVAANEKIAAVEAYAYHDTEEDDYWVDFRLVFGDGSPIDVQTYFENGFNDFIAEVNTLIDDLNADYDWGLEHVDYGN